MTDLMGANQTVVLDDGLDPGGSYQNSVGLSELDFIGNEAGPSLWPQASELGGAIEETGGTIAVYVGDGSFTDELTLTLVGANSYTGGTYLNHAVLIADDPQSLGNNDLVFNGDAAFEAGVTQTLNLLSLGANVTAILGAADNELLTVSGPIVFDGGAQTELVFNFYDENVSFDNTASTAGEILLDPSGVGANFFGSIVIANGALFLGNANAAALLSSSQGGISIGNGSELQVSLDLYGQDITAYNLSGHLGAVITDGKVGIASTLTVDNTGDSEYEGVIQNGQSPVSLVVDANAFTFTLTNDGSSYSGGTTILSGTLEISNNSIGAAALTFDGASGATLIADDGFNLANAIVVTANTSATIEEATGDALSLAAPGANGFTVGSGAALHFGGANATGAIYLDLVTTQTVGAGATLAVDGGFLLAQDALGAQFMGQFASVAIGTDLATFAIIDLNGFDLTLNNLSGDVRGNLQNDSATAATLTLNNTTNTTFDGNIHGSPQGQSFGATSVVISGNSVLTFTDDETYIGGTTIDSGATLNLGDDATGHRGTLLGGVTDNGVLELSWSFAQYEAFAGVISGAGRVEIGNGAIVELSGHNNFSGGVTLDSNAALEIGVSGAAGSGIIDFAGREITLRYARGALSTTSVQRLERLTAGDCIDLRGVTATSAVVLQNSKLVVLNGQTKVAQFQLVGSTAGLLLSTLRTSAGTFVYADVKVASFAALQSQLDLAMDGFAVIGSAANLAANITPLISDAHVELIAVADNAAVTLSAAQALAVLPKLDNANGTAGIVAISDTSAAFVQAIDLLAPQAARISSITFTDTNPTPVLNLTKAQKMADSALLGDIVGPWILDVHNTDQSILQIGHGDNLTINAVGGVDTIIGGGVNETFNIAKGFGSVTLVDLNAHLLGLGHDFVDLSKSEFASFLGVLNHTSVDGANLVIAKGGDTLTLDNMNLSQLTSIAAHFHFV